VAGGEFRGRQRGSRTAERHRTAVFRPLQRDRIEEAGKSLFERAAKGCQAIAAGEPQRVRKVDTTGTIQEISQRIWKLVEPLVGK